MEYLKSTLTATEKEVVKSVVLGTGNHAPEKIDDDEYEELFGEVLGAEMQAMKRQPLTARQREILQEEVKHYKGGVEGLAKNLHCHPDHIKAALGDKEAIKGLITSTIDNMQFISEVIDRYKKYAPALEAFDKIATKEDITAWLEQVDKMVGKDIDDPLRQAATSLTRLNEAQYPTFLACMEEYRKDPLLLSSVYFDKVSGGEIAQENLTKEDLDRISEMLKETHTAYEKSHKAGEAEDKRPLIKVIYDEELSNSRGRDYYFGDNGRYFTRQPEGALSYDNDGKVIKDNWKWVICTDNYYLEPDFAYDKYARFEIVDSFDKTTVEDLKSVLDDSFLMGEEIGKRIYFAQPIPFENEAGSWRAIGVHCGSKNYEIEDNEGNKIPYGIFGRYDQIAAAVKEAIKAPMEHQDFKFAIGRNDFDIHISSLDGREGFVAMMSLSGNKNLLADPIVMDEDISRVFLDVKENTDVTVRAKFAEAVADRHFGDLTHSIRHQEEIVAGYREAGLLDKPIDLVKPVVYDIQMSDKVAEVSDSGIHTCVALYKDLDDAKEHIESSFFLDQGSKSYSQAMYDSLKETLAVHLEQNAKHAIHDRIINSWQRTFTPNQVDALNRYHQVVAPGTPAGEIFNKLLHEVAQELDVRRCPEKWITDTSNELDDLAEGIVREESRGLHK